MITNRPFERSNSFNEQPAQSAEDVVKATQRATDEAVNNLADSVKRASEKAAPLLDRASEQASALAQRGMDALRGSTQQLQDKAKQASATTVSYIKDEPVKSILIAAATGAVLMALISLIGRSRNQV